MPRESTAPAGHRAAVACPASSKQLACEQLDAGQPPGSGGGQHPRADVDPQGPFEPIDEMGQHQARAAGQVDQEPIAAKRLAGGHDRIGRIEEAAVGVVLVQVAATRRPGRRPSGRPSDPNAGESPEAGPRRNPRVRLGSMP